MFKNDNQKYIAAAAAATLLIAGGIYLSKKKPTVHVEEPAKIDSTTEVVPSTPAVAKIQPSKPASPKAGDSPKAPSNNSVNDTEVASEFWTDSENDKNQFLTKE